MVSVNIRLLLREYEETDFETIYTLDTNSAVRNMIGHDTPFSRQSYRAWFEANLAAQHASPRTRYIFIICAAQTGETIGRCRLQITHRATRAAEIGYCFFPQHWGQGYATESVQQLLHFAFEDLHLHRITAECRISNLASARVLEKVGMQLEGRLRKEQWAHGQWEDALLYAILEEDFAGLHPSKGKSPE